LEKYDGVVWTGFIWLRLWTRGELLWKRQWTFEFHKILVNSWIAERLMASEEGLSTMVWIS
jgi:hypothetical protein